ncbi:hypothetical protein ACF065_05175 [Streptomyces sp. NPDC015232]|uniref:hypothetical protein n=1 Tax=unclassified Streptomyces TaxID=2593676 RepID=UPI0036FB1BB6
MSASENSARNRIPRTGPSAVPDHLGPRRVDDPGADTGDGPTPLGRPHVRPVPLAEKARAAADAARGAGSGLWSAARGHRTATAGAAAGTAVALALAYGWGRRAGRLAARRDLGPLALFFARRG